MRLYFAGMVRKMLVEAPRLGIDSLLFSVFEVNSNQSLQLITNFTKKYDIKLFLDSGAFSIMTGTEHMTLNEYCDFVRLHGKKFHVVAALDVIGNPEASLQNYKYMLSNGAGNHPNFVLTFHRNAPIEYLDKIASMTDYIAIGGIAMNLRRAERIFIIRKAIDRLKALNSKARIHLFGVSDATVLKIFAKDIESADSTTYINGERFAKLYPVGGYANGQFEYTHRSCYGNQYDMTRYNICQMVRVVKEINEYSRR